MSGDVQLFYEDLTASAAQFNNSAINLQPDVSNLLGDDPGVEMPIGRTQLRTELNQRMAELHAATLSHWEASAALSSAIYLITSEYSELDEELSGEKTP